MITQQQIERLASLQSDDGIVSVHVRVDPRLAYERGQPAAKFKGAYARARRNADERTIKVLEREHDRILAFLEAWKQRGKALAIFSCTPGDIWEVHELDASVPSLVSVASTPDTQHLARILDEYPRLAVVMLDGGDARVYVAEQGEARGDEEARVDADLPSRHDQGGWSQARYQRHVEFHRSMLLREIAGRLSDLFYLKGFDRVVLVGVDDVIKEFETLLPPPLGQRVIGHLNADFKQENDEQIMDRARLLAAADERSVEVALVERIVNLAGQGDKGVLGIDDTLAALAGGKVDTIVVVEGLSVEGSRCLNCDYPSAQKFEQCPVCSSIACEDAPDLIGDAVEYALANGSQVNFVYGGAEELLQSRGGIGALLRYS